MIAGHHHAPHRTVGVIHCQLLQMTQIPLSGLAGSGLAEAQRRGPYDEPCRRMDGREYVDLDGDRNTGGGPAGHLD